MMIALVPVRDGTLPNGAAEAIAECGGRVIIVGSGTSDVDLDGFCSEGYLVELGSFEPGRWAIAIAPVVNTLENAGIVVLPNSPDGRDLAPRIAFALNRPLLAAATEISPDLVRVVRRGGLDLSVRRYLGTRRPGTPHRSIRS